jgi:hypothetical protein
LRRAAWWPKVVSVRISLRLLSGFVVLSIFGAARADSRWFDPKMGCGPVGAYARSGRASDLPGCTGRLPKDAPQVEVVMRELKTKLVDAEEALEKNKLDKVDPLVADVEAGLSRTLPVHPEMPDRWEQAQHIYKEAIGALRQRRALAPLLDGLRTAHAKARDVDRDRNRVEIEGGPAEAAKAATACNEAFAAARRAGVDGGLVVEIEPKRPRPLQESAADCAQILMRAGNLMRQQEKIMKARRKQWRTILKGERRKIFDAHPAQLPQFAGGPDDWRAVATSPSWSYHTASGVEVYTWKGNKVLERSDRK